VSPHSSAWFTSLASSLGHPGYVTLTEVVEAERDEPDAGRRGPGEMAKGHATMPEAQSGQGLAADIRIYAP